MLLLKMWPEAPSRARRALPAPAGARKRMAVGHLNFSLYKNTNHLIRNGEIMEEPSGIMYVKGLAEDMIGEWG